MTTSIERNLGSFRDPKNRVYEFSSIPDKGNKRILRGLDEETSSNVRELFDRQFFRRFLDSGHVIKSKLLSANDPDAKKIMENGWVGVLEHQTIPFVTYPYEWTFHMLKEAALLQLRLIEKSFEDGWMLKDATPYNIQWIGTRPVFIDIPSFEPWVEGEPWVGYRQFCSMYLTPLLFRAHLGIDHLPLLRSYIDGIPPTEAARFFSGTRRLKKGVLSHIIFPAKVEESIARRERDDAPAKGRAGRKQSRAMIFGLLQSLSRLVNSLSIEIKHTDWSRYDKTHSYQEEDFESKKAFVLKNASDAERDQVWDIGCNTGTFSRICSGFCNQVIAVDGDHNAIEQLYLAERGNESSNILPLVMNLANISPNHGWAGTERAAFDHRKKPDLILCLALIHHLRLSANIPIELFLRWLRSLSSDVIIEFVNREDEMVVKLLTNKKEQYDDYNIDNFGSIVDLYFTVKDQFTIKGGKREIFYLKPK